MKEPRDKPQASALAWHAVSGEDVHAWLDAPLAGLTTGEAEARLAKHGPNRLPLPKRRGPLSRFLQQFHNILIYVLLIAAVATMLLGHWVDAGAILGVVVINAIIGFVQEGRAERVLEAIRSMLSPRAVALRDGVKCDIAAHSLVPGDVVFLRRGDRVPADLRLTFAKGLAIDEAVLTGESVPVDKGTEAAPVEAVLADRACMAYSGTLVTRGQGRGVAVATGAATEIGRISAGLAEVTTLTTPLLRKLSVFAQYLTVAIFALATAAFAFGVFARGFDFEEMLLASVGLAVAAIPEGLPAIMTIALAVGVRRMAARHAIIRRLPAVETIGSATVICSDKTGTFTRNEMTVQSIATAEALILVSGSGYAPSGDFTRAGVRLQPSENSVLLEILRTGMLCSDATIHEVDGEWRVEGDPMEGALLAAAGKAGLDWRSVDAELPRVDVIPFDPQHRFMATLNRSAAGAGLITVKGAPERVIEMCKAQHGSEGELPLDLAYWYRRLGEMAAEGQRVLAIARRTFDRCPEHLTPTEIDDDLILLGLFGFADPVREEAIEAVARCQRAGIHVKMITGDHASTAEAIGRRLGLRNIDEVVTGHDLDNADADTFAALVEHADIFARTSPEHKLRLVEALQAKAHIVAMTGDGVNDAPALKRADIGIAMGRKGTEVAKEASEVVLADDNFASIAHAVQEGRVAYDNLTKAILFILPTNGAEALVLVTAILFGQALPISAVQILWVNMITEVTLSLALAFEPAESDVMSRLPRASNEPILSLYLVWRIVLVSVIGIVCTYALFLWEVDRGSDLATARTAAVNTLVLFEAFYLLNMRYLRASVVSIPGLFGNPLVLAGIVLVVLFQVIFTYAPPMQVLFGTSGIGGTTWLLATLAASSVFFIVEAEKWLYHTWHRGRPRRTNTPSP